MIRGLQITLSGEELSRRIGERIRVHETKEIGRAVPAFIRAGDRIVCDEWVTTHSVVTMVGLLLPRLTWIPR